MDMSKEIKNEALFEMAGTEGWKIVEEMLVYDTKFALSLLTKPKPSEKNSNGEYISKPEWIIKEHEIGRARGILTTAQKYLDMIKNARERFNKI